MIVIDIVLIMITITVIIKIRMIPAVRKGADEGWRLRSLVFTTPIRNLMMMIEIIIVIMVIIITIIQ